MTHHYKIDELITLKCPITGELKTNFNVFAPNIEHFNFGLEL